MAGQTDSLRSARKSAGWALLIGSMMGLLAASCASAERSGEQQAPWSPTEQTPPPRTKPSAPLVLELTDERIDESSGLAASRRHPGIYWTHNDSGDRPRIFAIDRRGGTVAEIQIDGAKARDWEDIAIDDAGKLYLGDIGNNANRRRDLTVYRIAEPDPAVGDGSATVEAALRYRYADQSAYPQPERSAFDAEALFWRAGSLYILTKHRTDTWTTLYRLATTPQDEEQVLQPLQQIDVGWTSPAGGNVTAADLHPDQPLLALLTYQNIQLFDVSGSGDELRLTSRKTIALRTAETRQAESLCWDGSSLLFGNEQRGLFRIDEPLAPGRTVAP